MWGMYVPSTTYPLLIRCPSFLSLVPRRPARLYIFFITCGRAIPLACPNSGSRGRTFRLPPLNLSNVAADVGATVEFTAAHEVPNVDSCPRAARKMTSLNETLREWPYCRRCHRQRDPFVHEPNRELFIPQPLPSVLKLCVDTLVSRQLPTSSTAASPLIPTTAASQMAYSPPMTTPFSHSPDETKQPDDGPALALPYSRSQWPS